MHWSCLFHLFDRRSKRHLNLFDISFFTPFFFEVPQFLPLFELIISPFVFIRIFLFQLALSLMSITKCVSMLLNSLPATLTQIFLEVYMNVVLNSSLFWTGLLLLLLQNLLAYIYRLSIRIFVRYTDPLFSYLLRSGARTYIFPLAWIFIHNAAHIYLIKVVLRQDGHLSVWWLLHFIRLTVIMNR